MTLPAGVHEIDNRILLAGGRSARCRPRRPAGRFCRQPLTTVSAAHRIDEHRRAGCWDCRDKPSTPCSRRRRRPSPSRSMLMSAFRGTRMSLAPCRAATASGSSKNSSGQTIGPVLPHSSAAALNTSLEPLPTTTCSRRQTKPLRDHRRAAVRSHRRHNSNLWPRPRPWPRWPWAKARRGSRYRSARQCPAPARTTAALRAAGAKRRSAAQCHALFPPMPRQSATFSIVRRSLCSPPPRRSRVLLPHRTCRQRCLAAGRATG